VYLLFFYHLVGQMALNVYSGGTIISNKITVVSLHLDAHDEMQAYMKLIGTVNSRKKNEVIVKKNHN